MFYNLHVLFIFSSSLISENGEKNDIRCADFLHEFQPKKGITNILIVAPGFSSDCLETIEEIDEENKEIFMNAGGKNYNYVPCLNDSDKHVKVFKDVVKINS